MLPTAGQPISTVCSSLFATEPGFPAALRRMPVPTQRLWFTGRLPRDGETAVAMVGSRAASRAGCDRAEELAAAVARRGVAVVSGRALGIDAAAHRRALAA